MLTYPSHNHPSYFFYQIFFTNLYTTNNSYTKILVEKPKYHIFSLDTNVFPYNEILDYFEVQHLRLYTFL